MFNISKVIYVVYLLLPLLLLWQSESVSGEKFNDEFLSIRQTKAFQGFLAICIMLHHIGQKTCASWLPKQVKLKPGLELFVPSGFLLVSVFVFFNGYGLYKSFHTKENYLKGFFKKRILPIVLALYSTTLVFFVARLLLHEEMDRTQVIYYLTSIKLCNPYTWYVIVLPFFYLAFYLAFKFVKKDGIAVALVCLFSLAYALLGTSIDHNDVWMRGQWWYNCMHLFPIGVLFAKFENKIVPHLKKHYLVYLCAALLLFLPLYYFSENISSLFGYYGENWAAPDKILRRRVTLLSEMLPTTDFVFVCLLLGMKVKIGNKFLDFMGKITLEFYLVHGLFVELFAYAFDGALKTPYQFKNVIVYVIVVFALGVPSALLLQKFHHLVLGIGSKKNKSPKQKAA